jgi:hypothetical protein
MLRPRNFIARSPLLRKGGAHQRSQSGKRREHKESVEQALMDWQEQSKEDDIQREREPKCVETQTRSDIGK